MALGLSGVADAQALSSIPKLQIGACYSAALSAWIPIHAAISTALPYVPVPIIGLAGQNGTSYYPVQCDSNGNLIVSTPYSLTGAATGGAAPGTAFNGSAAVTFDYHSLGAQAALAGATTNLPTGSLLDVTETAAGLYGVNNANGFFQTNLPNDGSTATVVNKTVCENSSGNAQMCGANVKSHVVGACTAGCGSTGYPKVAVRGNIATLTFDATAAVVAGDWVVTSATAGLVADSGSSTYPTCGNQVVGVATTSGLASTTESVLIRPDALPACLTGIRQANNTAADTAATSANIQTAIGAGVYDASGAAAARAAVGNCSAGQYGTATTTSGLACAQVAYSQVSGTPSIPSVGTWGALNYPTWASGTPFVKMTAAGTFALDTNTYGTFTLPSLTSGSVLFSNGSTIAQDNANFFWDATNHRLGIGTTSPGQI